LLHGTDKSFKCAGKGVPEPSVTWYKDGKKVESKNRLSVHADGTLRLSGVTAAVDNGVYTCVAMNLGGQMNSSATVKVYCKAFEF
jgi:hypothetical protein